MTVIQRRIAGQGTAGQLAFQEIMAQNASGYDIVLGTIQKRFGINNALSHKGAAAQRVVREISDQGIVGICAAAAAHE